MSKSQLPGTALNDSAYSEHRTHHITTEAFSRNQHTQDFHSQIDNKNDQKLKPGWGSIVASEIAIATSRGKFPSNSDCLLTENDNDVDSDEILLSENLPFSSDGGVLGACGTAVLAVPIDENHRLAPCSLFVCLSLDPRSIDKSTLRLGGGRGTQSTSGQRSSSFQFDQILDDNVRKEDLKMEIELKESAEQSWQVVTGQTLVGIPTSFKLEKAKYTIGAHIQRKLLDRGRGPENAVMTRCADGTLKTKMEIDDEEDEGENEDIEMARLKSREAKAMKKQFEKNRLKNASIDNYRTYENGTDDYDQARNMNTFDDEGNFTADNLPTARRSTKIDRECQSVTDSSGDRNGTTMKDSSQAQASPTVPPMSPSSRHVHSSPTSKRRDLMSLPPIPPSGAQMTDFALKTRLIAAGLDDKTVNALMLNGARSKDVSSTLSPSLFQTLNVEVASGLLAGSGRKSVGSQTTESVLFSDKLTEEQIQASINEAALLLKNNDSLMFNGIRGRLQEIVLENEKRKRLNYSPSSSQRIFNSQSGLTQDDVLSALQYEKSFRAEAALVLGIRARELTRTALQDRLKPKLADFSSLLPLSRLPEVNAFARWPRGLCQAMTWVLFLHRTVEHTLRECVELRRGFADLEYHKMIMRAVYPLKSKFEGNEKSNEGGVTTGDANTLIRLYQSLYKGSEEERMILKENSSSHRCTNGEDSLAVFTADWLAKKIDSECLTERMLFSFVKSVTAYQGIAEVENWHRDAVYRKAFGQPPAAPDGSNGQWTKGMFGVAANGGDFSFFLEVYCKIVGLSSGCLKSERFYLEKFFCQLLRAVCKQVKIVEDVKKKWRGDMMSKANTNRVDEVLDSRHTSSPFNIFKRKLQLDNGLNEIANLMFSVGNLTSSLDFIPNVFKAPSLTLFSSHYPQPQKSSPQSEIDASPRLEHRTDVATPFSYPNSAASPDGLLSRFLESNNANKEVSSSSSPQLPTKPSKNSTSHTTPQPSNIKHEKMQHDQRTGPEEDVHSPLWNLPYQHDPDPIVTLLKNPYDVQALSELFKFNSNSKSGCSVDSFDRGLMDNFSLWEAKKLILPASAAIRAVLECFNQILIPYLGGSGLMKSDFDGFLSTMKLNSEVQRDHQTQQFHLNNHQVASSTKWMTDVMLSPVLSSVLKRVCRYISDHFDVGQQTKELKRIREMIKKRALDALTEASKAEQQVLAELDEQLQKISTQDESNSKRKKKQKNLEANIQSKRDGSKGNKKNDATNRHLAKMSMLIKQRLGAALESALHRKNVAMERLNLIDHMENLTFENLSIGGENVFDKWKPLSVMESRAIKAEIRTELEEHPFGILLSKRDDKRAAIMLSECYLPISIEPLLRVCVAEWEVFHSRMHRQVSRYVSDLLVGDEDDFLRFTAASSAPLYPSTNNPAPNDFEPPLTFSSLKVLLKHLDPHISDAVSIDLLRELKGITPLTQTNLISPHALAEILLRHQALLHRLFRLVLMSDPKPIEPPFVPLQFVDALLSENPSDPQAALSSSSSVANKGFSDPSAPKSKVESERPRVTSPMLTRRISSHTTPSQALSPTSYDDSELNKSTHFERTLNSSSLFPSPPRHLLSSSLNESASSALNDTSGRFNNTINMEVSKRGKETSSLKARRKNVIRSLSGTADGNETQIDDVPTKQTSDSFKSIKTNSSTNGDVAQNPPPAFVTANFRVQQAIDALQNLKIPLDPTFERALLEFSLDAIEQWLLNSSSSATSLSTDAVLVANINESDGCFDSSPSSKKSKAYTVITNNGRNRILTNLSNRLQNVEDIRFQTDEVTSLLQVARQWLSRPNTQQVFSESWRVLRAAVHLLIASERMRSPLLPAKERFSAHEAISEVDTLANLFESECVKTIVRAIGPSLLDQWTSSERGSVLFSKVKQIMSTAKETLLLSVSDAASFEGLSTKSESVSGVEAESGRTSPKDARVIPMPEEELKGKNI
eukprot:GDKJ01059335.1.p1 GENE.GDKJ01059335.1~~GDKJ01059335.1.p1  ORF type:complete len:2100 (+),score=486.72 GDKJ01059335.1:432-6302(+)